MFTFITETAFAQEPLALGREPLGDPNPAHERLSLLKHWRQIRAECLRQALRDIRGAGIG